MYPEQQQQPETPRQRKKKASPLLGLLGLLVVAGLCVIGGVLIFGGGDDKKVDPVADNRSTNAEVMCEQFIEKRLKAPATAEYPKPETSKDGATYTVRGGVDSENGFGAKIRTAYTCIVRDNGDTWTLVDLQMT